MYFNRKNAEQKNWRMIKKGKHFLFGCSLVFAVGATLVAPSVKADTVEAKPETSSTTDGTKPVVSEENPTYAAPAVEVAPVVATGEKAEKPVEPTQNSEEEPVVATEKAKEADSIQAPEVTVVYNPAALTDEEKAKVVAAVKAANPTATDVQVQADGSVVVAFADGSRANLTAAQTIKDGSLVAKPRTNRALRATAPRASEGAENLEYTNKKRGEVVVDDYIKISYKVDNAKNVIHWTTVVNGGRVGNAASGYTYFTVPKDSVGTPTNWNIVQTDKNGKVMSTRTDWKNNDGSYVMGAKGKTNVYTGDEMTKKLTQYYKNIGNPALKGKEAEAAAQAAARSQALYTLTADVAGDWLGKNPSWTITYDTPILDKSKPLDYVAGLQGTGGAVGAKTEIMTGYMDNFIDNASSKFQAVAVKENYTAKVGGSFAADPATYVTNKAGTPEFPNNYRGATSFKWKDGQAPTATEAGTYTKTVVVTYPAHYKQAPQEVTITFEVKDPRSDADKYTPVAKDQTVKPGDKPSAKDSIGNVGDLPEGTTFEFKTPVDTATDGEKDATVVVTYPDKSTEEVPVKVTVKTP
ncbi:Rib/alpha-like domain-containing protein, partial [uncultured Streptococcus sp.]|uniref:Rib/alpha-like domain-containing protein n=1 Tax=uncultured Streptococcus sp. TaxID=83427 RepID=UPI00288BA0F3